MHRLLCGDWIEKLRRLPDESVHCVVTSPPYFGLRDYKSAGQIGLESSPAEWIDILVKGFREVRRVLHSSGTLWINCGDSYVTNPHGNGATFDPKWPSARNRSEGNGSNRNGHTGLKSKNMMGMPWRLALALQADGWYWRQWMPWIKRSGMPESSSDRPVTACEAIFLFSKNEKYFYDAEAVKVLASGNAHARGSGVNPKAAQESSRSYNNGVGWGKHGTLSHKRESRVKSSRQNASFSAAVHEVVPHRMRRNHDWFMESWQGMLLDEEGDPMAFVVNPKGYSEQMCTACREIYIGQEFKKLPRIEVVTDGHKRSLAVCKCGKSDCWLSHTATFPRKLVEPMILAGTSEHGCCPGCLSPYERVLEKTNSETKVPAGWDTGPGNHHALAGKYAATEKQNGQRRIGEARERLRAETGKHDDYFPQKVTVGWEPTCGCSKLTLLPETRPPIPCTVLDPFNGSGTSGVEAVALGRSYVGIDINEDYLFMAERRIASTAQKCADE